MSRPGKVQELCVAALTNDKYLYEKWAIIICTGEREAWKQGSDLINNNQIYKHIKCIVFEIKSTLTLHSSFGKMRQCSIDLGWEISAILKLGLQRPASTKPTANRHL